MDSELAFTLHSHHSACSRVYAQCTYSKLKYRADKMAWQVKVLTTKPDNQFDPSDPHSEGREPTPPYCLMATVMPYHRHIHT